MDSAGDVNATNGTSGSPKVAMDAEMVVVVVFLTCLTFVTVLLNGAVITAICTTKKLHLPANYLICSLAATDLLVAVLVMPLSVLSIAAEVWPLGRTACDAWLSLDMTCCTCSILHLCAIALDRYWAITNAIEYACKRTPRRAGVMVAVVWAISALISVPPLFWRRSGDRPHDPTLCLIQHDHVGYTLYSTFGAFYAPMALILVLYCRIYSAAKALYQKRGSMRRMGPRGPGSQSSLGHCRTAHAFCVSEISTSDPAPELDRLGAVSGGALPAEAGLDGDGERSRICLSRERKAARILGLILGAFVLCWLPFFLKELLVGLRLMDESPLVSNTLTWLGYINSLVNPLLYTSFNEDFKQAFRRFLRCKGRV
ncbi:5-hydroxytryptamine receptor 1E-like [Megalops cyprinoides]|uniref:5-hydroxytryptamine receptor 1E-like n=1 Tax=Megalops cyprinoides TaxID=118141 RepID=UPI001864A6FB|nr:5-hydroxytryptamine receptor 1E-like [Megalops cyprinoides]